MDLELKHLSIEARKFDGYPHYSWDGYVLEQTKNYLLIANTPGRTLHHHRRDALYTYDNYSLEFYPLDADFTVGLDLERTGEVTYYCNICLPPILQGNTLSFIDLDLDLVQRNGEWKVVDEDEFLENQKLYDYPSDVIERARASLLSLQRRIAEQQFPFDGFFDAFIPTVLQMKRRGNDT
ncbi:DUF402 domain-containing protein [Exiguobacterium sp. s168]|uniref:DUF402 domain-containing protein n=1 Tax=Exiguobacterium sp. s168 TaxID=2751194 RepID=UPI001BE7559E